MGSETLTYSVPGVTCEHCRTAITREVGTIPGVESVQVDLEQKLVTVSGPANIDPGVRVAIDDAGYDVDEPQLGAPV